MSLSNLCLCYEGTQRIYRNAVVMRLRSSLKTAHPDNYSAEVKKPFEKEWEQIVASAQQRRQTGEITSDIVDEFDYLSVNHFFNLFDIHYDLIFKTSTKVKEDQKRLEKQKLLEWTKTVKNLRDPVAHPSEKDYSFDDSFILLDCAKRILLRLELHDEAKQISNLMSNLSGRIISVGLTVEPLEDRLPPGESIVVEFIGRESELTLLWDWVLNPVSRRWALAGEGGKGKSALAFKFATEVKMEAVEPLQIILWLSAKKKSFYEGQVVEISRPDFANLDGALSHMLVQFGWNDEAEDPTESKRKRVLELLDTFPALVVVDDIDSLEGEDEDAIEFFTFSVPQTKSKVLLTSRRVVFGLGNATTHVRGFSEDEAKHFIVSRCKLMDIESRPIIDRIGEIMTVTEASPLYIEDLMRFLSIVQVDEAIRTWSERGGDEARHFALGRELDMLSATAGEVLIAACIGEPAISFAELAIVTGLSKQKLTGALLELQRLFLVPKPQLIEGEQRFDVNINTRALVRRVFRTSDVYRRVEHSYKRLTGDVPTKGRGAISAIIRQATLRVRSHEYEEAKILLSQALVKYPENPNLTGFLGWVYKSWSPVRLTEAREKFKRAWELGCKDQEMYKHWIRMEIEEREWTQAAEAAECGLKFLPKNQLLLFFIGYSRGRLGKELTTGFQHERGNEELQEAQSYLRRALDESDASGNRDMRLNADIYRALVLNCETLEDKRGLGYYFRKWKEEHPDDLACDTEWERISSKFNLKPLVEPTI